MTEYEKSLTERVANIGDDFILKGKIYTTITEDDNGSCDSCDGCVFHNSHLCKYSPRCDINDVIYLEKGDTI